MALDDTDRRLVNGLIYLVVLGALAFYLPWHIPGVGFAGYQTQKTEEEEARSRLREKAKGYEKFYAQMHEANFGGYSPDPGLIPAGKELTELKKQYTESNAQVGELITLKEQASRMQFPDWTGIPATDEKNPGVYFAQMWQRKKNVLQTRLDETRVVCGDADIGFKEYTGKVNISRNEAEEYLRELYIAEKIILLCIEAKLREEAEEKAQGLQAEAYMKIVSIKPERSVATGPSMLVANPRYSPDEKNPMSERFRKYNVKMWKSFIQEYPVEIVLQCDVNTFMRFLHSVRAPGQFLVIRNLEVLSPFLDDSKEDRTEMTLLKPDADKDSPKRIELFQEHVLLKMSAAGMDFFDPTKNPRGLYDNPTKGNSATPTGSIKRPKFRLPTE
ncbi:MAG TPA: hypothetical protein VGP72_07305 [Planctomycetota bacterium]|jgi:hypothetical protein